MFGRQAILNDKEQMEAWREKMRALVCHQPPYSFMWLCSATLRIHTHIHAVQVGEQLDMQPLLQVTFTAAIDDKEATV